MIILLEQFVANILSKLSISFKKIIYLRNLMKFCFFLNIFMKMKEGLDFLYYILHHYCKREKKI